MRNVLALIAGIVIGSLVNMALVTLSPIVIPPPAGVDVSSTESMASSIHLFEPEHFLMPFLAHALGTLTGGLTVWLLAVSHKMRMAWAIGAVFLCGGIAACFLIPAPAWFMALDLLAAYLPMSWLAGRIGARLQLAPASTSR